MTFVGKILVVLILVFSLVFMTTAAMVFATHTNWKNEAQALMAKITALENQLAALTDLRKNLEEQLANERASLERRNGQLQSELTEAVREHDAMEQELATKTQEARDAVAAMTATQATLADLRNQIASLNTAIDQSRKERDDALAKSREDEDALAQVQADYDRAKKRQVELARQVAQLDMLRQVHDLHPEKIDYRVEGVVLDSRDNGMIEISIGFDDGLEIGNLLEVFRYGADAETSKYLGRARVVRVEADRAVAEMIRELQKGPIQRDDRVATRLR
jgi:predicted  nucleic acid-binding Zn-ribbon protein